MAYDEVLAERIRGLIGEDPRVVEKKMFGGLAFLVNGHMAVSTSRAGGIMVRVPAGESARLEELAGVAPMVMRGRAMTGWLRVDADVVGTDGELEVWVERGTGYARSLPPKG